MSKYAYYGHMETDIDPDDPEGSFDLLKAQLDLAHAERDFARESLDRMRRERDEALELVSAMREHSKEIDDLLEGWIDVFEMQQDERGIWMFDNQTGLFNEHQQLLDDHRKLIGEWNKMVSRYNATVQPQDRGRPLAASDAQAAKVKELRRAGQSLRAIASETGLSLRTVRTVLDNAQGKSRDTAKKAEIRRKEFSRLRGAAFRARKRKLESLPKELARLQKSSSKLDKEARGLGKNA